MMSQRKTSTWKLNKSYGESFNNAERESVCKDLGSSDTSTELRTMTRNNPWELVSNQACQARGLIERR